MHRRQFISASIAALQLKDVSGPRNPVRAGRMKLGCQSGPQTDERLEFFARHGVGAICGSLPPPADGRIWTSEELVQFRERVEKHNLTVDMIAPPFLESTHVDRTRRPAIMLGRSPDRDRDVEDIQKLIRSCARAGIPAIKYNLNLLGLPRTSPVRGRGRLDAECTASFGGGRSRGSDHERRPSNGRHFLGAHHLVPATGGACGRRIPDPDGLPPS